MTLRLLAVFVCLLAGAIRADTPRNDPFMQARSVHLFYIPQFLHPESAMVTMTVKEAQENSFYMALGWNSGYFGLQDFNGYRIFIFSVWEPGDPHDYKALEKDVPEESRAKILFAAENVVTERFEHEGTGAKTFGNIAWKENEPVSFRVDSEPENDERMIFTAYIKMNGDKDWYKLASVSTICKEPEYRCVGNVCSFIEDFWRNGESAKLSRSAEFRNIKTRRRGDERWGESHGARFTADPTPSQNIDAGPTEDGGCFLKTGGDTKNEHVKLWETFAF